MSHMPECRHQTAECNCEALEAIEDLRDLRAKVHALPCMSPDTCCDDCATCALRLSLPCHATRADCEAATAADIAFLSGKPV